MRLSLLLSSPHECMLLNVGYAQGGKRIPRCGTSVPAPPHQYVLAGNRSNAPQVVEMAQKWHVRAWRSEPQCSGNPMTWWKEIQTAIEQRDATVLRKMAEEAQKETRMFLNLLAGMIDR